jgi:hypothetical protein
LSKGTRDWNAAPSNPVKKFLVGYSKRNKKEIRHIKVHAPIFQLEENGQYSNCQIFATMSMSMLYLARTLASDPGSTVPIIPNISVVDPNPNPNPK